MGNTNIIIFCARWGSPKAIEIESLQQFVHAKEKCVKCGAEVAISPASKKLVEVGAGQITCECWECYQNDLRQGQEFIHATTTRHLREHQACRQAREEKTKNAYKN